MSINFNLLSESEFYASLGSLISKLEGSRSSVYYDTKKIPTIGIGFNLLSPSVRDKVFEVMGLNEQQIESAKVALRVQYANNFQLENALNRAIGYQFELTSLQIDAVFKSVINDAIVNVREKLGLPDDEFSRELVALVSLYHNSPSLIGNGLINAFSIEDPYIARAEAWYQIRYAHADELHKRRYVEAEVFGLYENGVSNSVEEAMGVYRWYSSKASQGNTSDPLGIIQYDTIHQELIYEANRDLSSVVGISGYAYVEDFKSELQQAKHDLSLTLNALPSVDSPFDIFVSGHEDSILESNSTRNTWLFGGDGNDYIKGNSGDDGLIGGNGNDLIEGGDGRDTIYGQDGNDIIYGGLGQDFIYGGDGDDMVYGEGYDIIYGGNGNDHLYSGEHGTRLNGEAGNDVLHGDGEYLDYMDGGDGFDLYYAGQYDYVTDSDGSGAVYLNNILVSDFYHDPNTGSPEYPYSGLFYDSYGRNAHFANGSVTIFEPGASGDSITINSFKNGDLGITIHPRQDANLLGSNNFHEWEDSIQFFESHKNYSVLVDALNMFDFESDVELDVFIPTKIDNFSNYVV
ncbi:hypothetical protein [Rheinheimera faecalis]